MNGPNAGAVVANLAALNGNGLLIDNLLSDVEVADLSEFVNDLKITKRFDLGGGALEVSGGCYKSIQQVETVWSFNFFLQEARGDNAALIDVELAGAPLTVNGVRAFGIFDLVFDLSFDRDAIYGAAVWSNDVFTCDGSVGYEHLQGTGTSNLASPIAGVGGFVPRDIDVNSDGILTPAETGIGTVDRTNLFAIDYNVDCISYSFG